MSDYAKLLYEAFFMRDLIGKIVPGSIISVAIYNFLDEIMTISFPPFFDDINLLSGLILLGIFQILGLCVQILGELIGYHSAHPRPRLIILMKTKNGKKARELFNDRLTKLKEKSLTPSEANQRERFVALKEGSGNFGFALLLSQFTLYYNFEGNYPIIILVLVLSFISYRSHIVHRSRQAYFEYDLLG